MIKNFILTILLIFSFVMQNMDAQELSKNRLLIEFQQYTGLLSMKKDEMQEKLIVPYKSIIGIGLQRHFHYWKSAQSNWYIQAEYFYKKVDFDYHNYWTEIQYGSHGQNIFIYHDDVLNYKNNLHIIPIYFSLELGNNKNFSIKLGTIYTIGNNLGVEPQKFFTLGDKVVCLHYVYGVGYGYQFKKWPIRIESMYNSTLFFKDPYGKNVNRSLYFPADFLSFSLGYSF